MSIICINESKSGTPLIYKESNIMKKWKIYVLLIIIIISAGAGVFFLKYSNTKKSYQLGKTPHSYQYTLTSDLLLYKDNVKKNEENKFSGLYLKKLDTDNVSQGVLLSDSYYGCANVYGNCVIFIDIDYNIVEMNLENGGKEIIVENNSHSISDALIINDILYYIQETESDIFSLYALDLEKNNSKKIADNINPYYLYHYCGNAGVISNMEDQLLICNMAEGIVQSHDNAEYEIQGFLNDGTIIYYKDGKIYAKQDFDSDKSEILYENDNIYRIILQPEELLICTLDQYGLLEVFLYHFSQNHVDKIANANSVPRDFNEHYIVCAYEEEGIGAVELMERENGNISYVTTEENTNNTENQEKTAKEETEKETEENNAENTKQNDIKASHETNYKEKISDETMDELERLLKQYYKNNFPYPLVTFRVADNNHSAYRYHTEYSPGNILIFEVQTEHESGDLYRHITFARKDADAEWKFISEGY